MVDPIASQAQIITQQALSRGLAALLKQGPVQGQVQTQQAGGKTSIMFQGRPFTLDVQNANLKPGDAVLAKLVNGKLVLELLPKASDPGASSTSAAASRSVGQAVANLGLSGQSAHMLALAFLQAGIPLDRNALKELAQILPQISAEQVSTLSFLFSRGMPVNPAIVAFLMHLFGPKPRISETTNNVQSKLKEIEKKLDSDEEEENDPVLNASQRRRLRESSETVKRLIPTLNEDATPEQQKEFMEALSAALASPEALIQLNPLGTPAAFGEAIVQLLALLLELWPHFERSPHAQAFDALVQEVKQLHETLSGQAAQNLPPQSSDGFHPVYIQIPIGDEGKNRQLELRYTPKGKNKKAGNLEFRIDMSNLGPVHVGIQWEHPRISVSILVSDPKVQEFIQPLLDELREYLQQQGFQVQSVGVAVGEIPETLQPQVKEMKDSVSGLDIRV